MINLKENLKCRTYGIIQRPDGTALRDILLHREGRRYTVSVGTPAYIAELKEKNSGLPTALRSENIIFPMPDINDPQKVCRRLQETPIETLRPYLTEQLEPPAKSDVN